MLPHNDNDNENDINFLCSGNGNERNVMTPTLATLVVDHLAIWQYHI